MSKITIITFVCIALFAIQGFGQNENVGEQAQLKNDVPEYIPEELLEPQPTNQVNSIEPQEVEQPKLLQSRRLVIQPREPLPPNDPACPDRNARYPVVGQCDAYIECKDGQPEEKLCPDGLFFNDKVSVFSYPCQYPIDVDCTQRAKLQTPQATEDCPHQFGYFKVGDRTHCGQFMNCVDGRGYTFDCPEGLAFNKESYRCDWPDEVPDCDSEAYLGFKCPETKALPEEFGFAEYSIRTYRSPVDCQRYFICVNGKPRLYNCGEGNAYNELINTCDGIENVTGCSIGPLKKQFYGEPTTLRYSASSQNPTDIPEDA